VIHKVEKLVLVTDHSVVKCQPNTRKRLLEVSMLDTNQQQTTAKNSAVRMSTTM